VPGEIRIVRQRHERLVVIEERASTDVLQTNDTSAYRRVVFRLQVRAEGTIHKGIRL
jgi:hypothetical protein